MICLACEVGFFIYWTILYCIDVISLLVCFVLNRTFSKAYNFPFQPALLSVSSASLLSVFIKNKGPN